MAKPAALSPPPNYTIDMACAASDIVQGIRAHDPASQSQLYHLIQRGIKGYFIRRAPEDAEDLFQAFYLTAVESLQRIPLRDPRRLMGFLRTILRRQFAAYAHHRKFLRTCVQPDEGLRDPFGDIEKSAIEAQRRTIILDLLTKLKTRDREILIRFYVHEQPKDVIIKELGLTENQFRLVKSRAKAEFTRRVQAYMNKQRAVR